MNSMELFGMIESVPSNIQVDLCGKTELKLTIMNGNKKVTGYIRHSRGHFILQAPLKKMDRLIGEQLADHYIRSNSKQAVYQWESLPELLDTVSEIVDELALDAEPDQAEAA